MDCKSIETGSHKCNEVTEFGFCADKCLIDELSRLRESGVETIGSCCGHDRLQGYIQVRPEHCEKMTELGYEQLPIDEFGNGHWCFKPKTLLPFQERG